MKKWSLALILSMAILAGCGSNQSSAQTTESNVEVMDNRTETEKSGGSGSTVVDNRQRKETAALFRASARAAGSLRVSSGRMISSMSFRAESRSRILRPVVPALPSIKT